MNLNLSTAFLLISSIFLGSSALSQEISDNPKCKGFIKTTCCCTNNACWEVESNKIQALGNDIWLHKPDGQTLKRTGWSKGEKAVVCAYGDGWVSDPSKLGKGNPLSCIYPLPSKELF